MHAGHPPELALIGEEVSGFVSASEITQEHLLGGGVLLPMSLADRLGAETKGVALPSGLMWFPRSGAQSS